MKLVLLTYYVFIYYIFTGSFVNAQNKDLFLVIGQSNTAGRADIETQDLAILSNVYLLDASGQWEPAQNPLNKYSTIRKAIEFQKLGFAYTFGKLMHEVLLQDIGLVVNARGGTNIDHWQKQAPEGYYAAALARTQIALSLPGTTLKGVVWHQGESNRNDGIAYIGKLQNLITDLRTDLGIPDLPLVSGELSYDRPENNNFNNILSSLPSTVPNTDYVSAEFLHTIDLTHFDSEAQRVLGYRYAAKMLELAYGHVISTQNIWVSEDSYVRGGIYANNNYNNEAYVRAKTVSNQDFSRTAFLKFNLSGITNPITDAILVLNGFETGNNTVNARVFETSNNWLASTITWNNKPASGDLLESVPVQGNTPTQYNIFLSEYAHNTQHSNTMLSVAIEGDSTTGGLFSFTSQEDTSNSSNQPYLQVTTITSNALSVSDLESQNNQPSIHVYPNPAKNKVYFKNLYQIIGIQLFDSTGKLVLERKDINTLIQTGLNIAHFSMGLYHLKFFNSDGNQQHKKLLIH